MSAGAYALIGVGVGILGAGAIDWLKAWVADRRAARIAARLLYEELARNHATIGLALKEDTWPDLSVTPNARIRRSAWDAHMAVLARPRDASPWTAVALAYMGLDSVAFAHQQAIGQPLAANDRKSLAHVHGKVDEALDVLDAQAGLPEDDEE